jgi:hypothetical protein
MLYQLIIDEKKRNDFGLTMMSFFCGHIMCEPCWKHFCAEWTKSKTGQDIECPSCRKRTAKTNVQKVFA